MARPTRGRPPRIDDAAIVQEALQIGLDDLTMRGLAARLGVGASTLYYHVGSLDELRDRVRDALLAELQLPDDARPWDEVLLDSARRLRGLFERAPGLAEEALSDTAWSDVVLGLHESACARLRAAGFGPAEAWLATRTVAEFVEGFVVRRRAHAAAGHRDLDDLWPEVDHPNLVAARAALPEDREEARFHFGLTCLLNGLRPMVDPR